MNSRFVSLILQVSGLLGLVPAVCSPPTLLVTDERATWARGIEGQRKADLGKASYLNPILPGDQAMKAAG